MKTNIDAGGWLPAIAEYADWLRVAGRAQGTVYLRRRHLLRLARDLECGPYGVTVEMLIRWLVSHQWGAEARRSARASLVSFYTWAHSTGRVGTNPARLLPAIAPAPGQPRPASEDAVQHALSRATGRVRLMVELAAFCGMRRGEVARCRGDRLVQDLLGGWNLQVEGKGGKVRTIPVPGYVASAIREAGEGWTFPGGDNGHVSPWWVGRLVSRVLPAGVTMHQLRHRFGTRAYQGTSDLLAVQQLLGHARPETTQRYVLVAPSALRRAVQAAA